MDPDSSNFFNTNAGFFLILLVISSAFLLFSKNKKYLPDIESKIESTVSTKRGKYDKPYPYTSSELLEYEKGWREGYVRVFDLEKKTIKDTIHPIEPSIYRVLDYGFLTPYDYGWKRSTFRARYELRGFKTKYKLDNSAYVQGWVEAILNYDEYVPLIVAPKLDEDFKSEDDAFFYGKRRFETSANYLKSIIEE